MTKMKEKDIGQSLKGAGSGGPYQVKSGRSWVNVLCVGLIKSNSAECPETGCWNWTGAAKTGFGYGQLGVAGGSIDSHRASYTVFRGPIPDGLCVLHSCDNPACVNPSHLFLGTKEDNVRDMIQKRRAAWQVGTLTNGKRKYTDDEVRAIRKRYDERGNVSQIELARRLGMPVNTLRGIGQRTRYIHVD